MAARDLCKERDMTGYLQPYRTSHILSRPQRLQKQNSLAIIAQYRN